MAKAKGTVAGHAAEVRPVQRWKVSIGGRTVTVEAENKLGASHKAACKLGVVWRETAREMQIEKAEDRAAV